MKEINSPLDLSSSLPPSTIYYSSLGVPQEVIDEYEDLNRLEKTPQEQIQKLLLDRYTYSDSLRNMGGRILCELIYNYHFSPTANLVGENWTVDQKTHRSNSNERFKSCSRTIERILGKIDIRYTKGYVFLDSHGEKMIKYRGKTYRYHTQEERTEYLADRIIQVLATKHHIQQARIF